MISYGMTHIGQKRSMNQDYIYFTDEPVGNLSNLYIVADGMGGHKAGDRASSFAVERFIQVVGGITKEQPFCIMKDAIEQVNTELYTLAGSKDDYEGMGTTFVAATIRGEQLYVMNIGDSRLYLYKDGLKQISLDHSFVEELVRSGEITREEAKNHPQKNYITRALGVDEKVQADFFQVELEPGNRILLCSDGLSNMVTDEEMESILKNENLIKNAVDKLITRANEEGGKDNIAVVIARNEGR